MKAHGQSLKGVKTAETFPPFALFPVYRNDDRSGVNFMNTKPYKLKAVKRTGLAALAHRLPKTLNLSVI